MNFNHTRLFIIFVKQQSFEFYSNKNMTLHLHLSSVVFKERIGHLLSADIKNIAIHNNCSFMPPKQKRNEGDPPLQKISKTPSLKANNNSFSD